MADKDLEDLLMSQLLEGDDGDSLFGGDDDHDCQSEACLDDSSSLFGGGEDDADVLSPFMDDASAAPSVSSSTAGTVCSSSGGGVVSALAPPPPRLLTLPSPPTTTAPAAPFFSPLPTLPALPLPLQPSPSPPESLLASPTPPCEGARSPGPQDVSTHSFQAAAETAASAAPADSAASDAFELEIRLALELELERGLGQEDQPINSPPLLEPVPVRDAQVCRGDELKLRGINPRAVDAAIKYGLRIPRRVDQPDQNLHVLIPYISPQSSCAMDRLLGFLCLDKDAGKGLTLDVEWFLSKSSRIQDIINENSGALTSDSRKIAMMHAALDFLRDHGKGEFWFGRREDNRSQRTLFWPDDSSILVCHTVTLLCKCMRSMRQRAAAAAKKPRTRRSTPGSISEASLQPLQKRKTPEGDLSRGPLQDISNLPIGMAEAMHRASLGQPVPMVAPPPVNLLNSGAYYEAKRRPSKKVKREDLAPACDPFTKVPADANLQYVIYIMRRATRVDPTPAMAIPPISLSHDGGLRSGGFWHVMGWCRDMGVIGAVEVFTPTGFVMVQTDQEWDAAVRNIYDEKIMGNVVKVRVQSYI